MKTGNVEYQGKVYQLAAPDDATDEAAQAAVMEFASSGKAPSGFSVVEGGAGQQLLSRAGAAYKSGRQQAIEFLSSGPEALQRGGVPPPAPLGETRQLLETAIPETLGGVAGDVALGVATGGASRLLGPAASVAGRLGRGALGATAAGGAAGLTDVATGDEDRALRDALIASGGGLAGVAAGEGKRIIQQNIRRAPQQAAEFAATQEAIGDVLPAQTGSELKGRVFGINAKREWRANLMDPAEQQLDAALNPQLRERVRVILRNMRREEPRPALTGTTEPGAMATRREVATPEPLRTRPVGEPATAEVIDDELLGGVDTKGIMSEFQQAKERARRMARTQPVRAQAAMEQIKDLENRVLDAGGPAGQNYRQAMGTYRKHVAANDVLEDDRLWTGGTTPDTVGLDRAEMQKRLYQPVKEGAKMSWRARLESSGNQDLIRAIEAGDNAGVRDVVLNLRTPAFMGNVDRGGRPGRIGVEGGIPVGSIRVPAGGGALPRPDPRVNALLGGILTRMTGQASGFGNRR